MSTVSISYQTIQEILAAEQSNLLDQVNPKAILSGLISPTDNKEMQEWLKGLWPDVWGPDVG